MTKRTARSRTQAFQSPCVRRVHAALRAWRPAFAALMQIPETRKVFDMEDDVADRNLGAEESLREIQRIQETEVGRAFEREAHARSEVDSGVRATATEVVAALCALPCEVMFDDLLRKFEPYADERRVELSYHMFKILVNNALPALELSGEYFANEAMDVNGRVGRARAVRA